MKKIGLLLLFIFTSLMVFAETKPVVVVVPFDAKGVSRDEVDVIYEVFLSEYVSTGVSRVVDRSSFDKIAKEHQFQLSEWSDSNKVAEMGKALNAQMAIVSQVAQFGSQVVFSNRCIDVNTQEIISSTVKRVSSVDRLFDECQIMAKELAEKTRGALMPFPIGSKGSDGGIVFRYEGDYRWEMSKSYNETDYPDNCLIVCCNPSGYSKLDWYLPSKSDMLQIYNNLVKPGIIKDTNKYITSDCYFSFETGDTCYSPSKVFYIRKFNVNNPNDDPSKDMYNMDGKTREYVFMYYEVDKYTNSSFGKKLFSLLEYAFKNSVYKLTFSSDFTYTLECIYPIYDVTISGAGVIGRKINDWGYCNVDQVKYISMKNETISGTWCYIRGQSDKVCFGLRYDGKPNVSFDKDGGCLSPQLPIMRCKNKNGDFIRELTAYAFKAKKYLSNSCLE